MKYVIAINADNTIKAVEYTSYHTLNDIVDGWYEQCGRFVMQNKMWLIFCNEEFLLRDDTHFNAVATVLCGCLIYGNVVIAVDGYNEDNERDAIPVDKEFADVSVDFLHSLVLHIVDYLQHLRAEYNDNKPEPQATIISFSPEESDNEN